MNPVEQRIAEGMSPIAAFLTEATCGEACWEAREDICRCSCGGKNHGCLRSKDGVRPVRNAKIDGFRYELKAVDGDVYGEAKAINDQVERKIGGYTYHPTETEAGAPARVKRASKDQLAKWPELAAARARIAEIDARRHCFIEIDRVWPYLLWVKVAA